MTKQTKPLSDCIECLTLGIHNCEVNPENCDLKVDVNDLKYALARLIKNGILSNIQLEILKEVFGKSLCEEKQ